MFRSVALGIFSCLLFAVAPARAERPPESPDDATHVVVGTVESVYTYDTREQRYYVVKIAVEQAERGDGVKEGDAFFVECFQRHRNAPRIPAAYGHKSVPKVDQRIRAWVMREGTRSEGIYNSWYELVK